MSRKSITVDERAFYRLKAEKRDGESWTELIDRATDALESQDDDATADPDFDALTEDHIQDIATLTARKTATEVESRLTHR